jgi:hypothetical protein
LCAGEVRLVRAARCITYAQLIMSRAR